MREELMAVAVIARSNIHSGAFFVYPIEPGSLVVAGGRKKGITLCAQVDVPVQD